MPPTMPRWRKGETEFAVAVNYVEGRGYATTIPKPVAERLGIRDSITFLFRRNRVEVVATDSGGGGRPRENRGKKGRGR